MSREAEHGIRYVVRLTTGRFAAQVVLVVSAFIIPRVMGAQSYGQYAAWLAMIAILRSASTLGLPMVEV
ncbi:MAG: hypothetical protein GY856_06515, partial [bacterium]|nr:hypothetical protein [bacterium]